MELRHLRYFIAVAEELHFGRAAARLYIAQPPLSQQIRQLERELGVTLLHRTRRHVELTDAGEVFLEEARRTLDYVDQAVEATRRAHRGEIGRLIIGFVGTAAYHILPTLLHTFHRQFPGVDLVLQELTTAQQLVALHEGQIHVGLLRSPVDDDLLGIQPILREPLILACAETHPLATRDRIKLIDLASEHFILFPRHLGAGLYDQIISVCQGVGFNPHVIQEAIQMPTIIGLVAVGLGVSLLPASIQSFQRLGVAYRTLEEGVPEVEVALAWLRNNPSSVLRSFLEIAKNVQIKPLCI